MQSNYDNSKTGKLSLPASLPADLSAGFMAEGGQAGIPLLRFDSEGGIIDLFPNGMALPQKLEMLIGERV